MTGGPTRENSSKGTSLAKGECLTDARGRPLSDLRLSVTDRCNFRCRYCMPREMVSRGSFLPRAEILRFEELSRITKLFVGLGVRKVRLTGGEPLLRRDLAVLVEQLAELSADLALTTNGVRLPECAGALARAGLGRVTVSLDALDEGVFQKMADAPSHSVAQVLLGVDAAERAGFGPLKINCVVRKGINESQVLPLVRYFGARGHIVRFIEYMDVGTRNEWSLGEVLTEDALLAQLRTAGELEELPPNHPGEVARRFRFSPKGGGPVSELGVIASVSRPFCGGCSRARLSADGSLFTCLFGTKGHDLRGPLREGHSDHDLRKRIVQLWKNRDDRYSELRSQQMDRPSKRQLPVVRAEMSYLGG